jgi:hypothetical protein
MNIMGRQAHAAQVGNDDSVIFNQRLGEGHPHIAGVVEAMKKQDGRSSAAEANVLSPASHRHLLCSKRFRPRANRHDKVLSTCRLYPQYDCGRDVPKPELPGAIRERHMTLWVKRCGASQARRRSLSAVDPIATKLLQRRE